MFGRVTLLLACLAAVSAGAVPPIPTPEQRKAALGIDDTPVPRPAPTEQQRAARELQDAIDVTRYLLDLAFQPSAIPGVNGSVSGTVTITARSLVDGLEHLVLDLRDNMTVSAASRGLVSLSWSHAGDILDVTLDQPVDAGQAFAVEVTYGGQPIPSGFGSIRWNKYCVVRLGPDGLVALRAGGRARLVAVQGPAGRQGDWSRSGGRCRADWIATGNGVLLGSRRRAGSARSATAGGRRIR